MRIERQISQILHEYLPAIEKGDETLESVLEKYPRVAHELRPALEACIWLQQAKVTAEPRVGFVSSTRKYLVERIASMQPASFWQRIFRRYSVQRWVFNFAAPIIVLLMLVLVINSAVLTARLSIPGEPLYSTKLVIEDVRLALTLDQVKRTDLTIEFSRRRAMEFVELVMVGEYGELPDAAGRMEAELIASLHALEEIPTEEAGKVNALVTNYRESLESEMQMLEVLRSTTPFTAQKGIEMAINVAQSGIWALH